MTDLKEITEWGSVIFYGKNRFDNNSLYKDQR